MDRSCGILMPVSSLPSPYGIGTFGKAAYDFADFLESAGMSCWQLLPLGPTGYGDSPYASFSTFAGNPYFIDPDMLAEDGLIDKEDLESADWGEDEEKTDYGRIYQSRFKVLRKAFSNGRERYKQAVEKFREENASWIGNYALFMAVKAHFGMQSWTEWPDEDIRLRKETALKKYADMLREDVDFYVFLQFLFYKQWDALKDYVHSKGIKIIGDVPIYVALDSSDVWSEPHFFLLDDQNLPTVVSGCPPDAFNEDGQLWGNPIYDYAKMEKDGFGWWIRRIEGAGKLYDIIRIDHFRGFESYWAVPYGEKTAKNGKWMPGPGMKLVGVLTSWFSNLEFIAEDLGYTTPEVKKLLADSGLPGMKVLEFAFEPDASSDAIPFRAKENSTCYIGTHDNDTVRGWLENFDEECIAFARKYMNVRSDDEWNDAFLRTGLASPSKFFCAQMQDILELGADARMNTPGEPAGNWCWRMKKDAITPDLAKKLRDLAITYGRFAEPVQEPEEDEETATEVPVKSEQSESSPS